MEIKKHLSEDRLPTHPFARSERLRRTNAVKLSAPQSL